MGFDAPGTLHAGVHPGVAEGVARLREVSLREVGVQLLDALIVGLPQDPRVVGVRQVRVGDQLERDVGANRLDDVVGVSGVMVQAGGTDGSLARRGARPRPRGLPDHPGDGTVAAEEVDEIFWVALGCINFARS
ncbi:MAG: hypothetical protein IPL36_13915 [Nigerium sp.]|nr:hypothetical protein [Nigerium sp.]